MTYNEIISEVVKSTGLNKTLVNKTYKAYWRAVREYIESLELKKGLSDEEFEKIRPNVNIPSIGKLYVSLNKYHRLLKKEEIININTKKKYGTAYKENQAS